MTGLLFTKLFTRNKVGLVFRVGSQDYRRKVGYLPCHNSCMYTPCDKVRLAFQPLYQVVREHKLEQKRILPLLPRCEELPGLCERSRVPGRLLCTRSVYLCVGSCPGISAPSPV